MTAAKWRKHRCTSSAHSLARLALVAIMVCTSAIKNWSLPADYTLQASAANTSDITEHAKSSDPKSEPAVHGLSAKAVEIARPLGFPITNSMLVSWIVAIALIVFAQTATRDMQQLPTRIPRTGMRMHARTRLAPRMSCRRQSAQAFDGSSTSRLPSATDCIPRSSRSPRGTARS